MEKNLDTADGKPIIDQNVMDLKNRRDRGESLKAYGAEEIEGTEYSIGFFREGKSDTMDLLQRGKFNFKRNSLKISKGPYGQKSAAVRNGVLEKHLQFEEAICSPVSWLDCILTVAAGLLIGIIVFGAFLY